MVSEAREDRSPDNGPGAGAQYSCLPFTQGHRVLSFPRFPTNISICLETRARLMSPRAASVCRVLFWMRRNRD